MTCNRTDAHTIAECGDYPTDEKVHEAFAVALQDALANGHWDPDLEREYLVSESELQMLWGK